MRCAYEGPAPTPPSEVDIEIEVNRITSHLSLDEKVSLLSGKDSWSTPALPAHDIPGVRMSDGPNGVRGVQFFNGTPSNSYACAAGLAASFDKDLAHSIGLQLGRECIAKRVHVLLGPTVNLHRNPLGGRNFECFSEDPLLTGVLAGSYINGVQARGIGTALKHFLGNEQETQRVSSNSVISARALRELYLEPFRIAIDQADPKCIMTSYNRVNGTHASENEALLNILRHDYGWRGLLLSDWNGTYSSLDSIKAGLDLEMPGPPTMRGQVTKQELFCGKLKESDLDASVRRVLGLAIHARASDVPSQGPEGYVDDTESRALLRKSAAAACVLLKHDRQVLPIDKARKIAVIGSNGRVAAVSGGGSASMSTLFATTPLAGIQTLAQETGASVSYSIGAASHLFLPEITPMLRHPSGDPSGIAQVEFWIEEPCPGFNGRSLPRPIRKPDFATSTRTANAFIADGVPNEILANAPYIRYTTLFTPEQDGDWLISLGSVELADLYLDGVLIVDNSTQWRKGPLFVAQGSGENIAIAENLSVDRSYELEVRYWSAKTTRGPTPFDHIQGIRIGAFPRIDDERAIEEAAEAASTADVAVIVVGLNMDLEGEGTERDSFQLPGRTDDLIYAVSRAQPNTVVVNQSGSPVAMPWADSVPAIVQASYGGNSVGDGIADVLFGKVNPSGKLPTTFPRHLVDVPSTPNFGLNTAESGEAKYVEDIFLGYRTRDDDRAFKVPMFPFGHGLSYSTFRYTDLVCPGTISDSGDCHAQFTLTCDGPVAGAEVVQVYVRDVSCRLPRPTKELRAFQKIQLEPGQGKQVEFVLDREAWKFWDDSIDAWVAEAGEFEIMIGSSSADIRLRASTTLTRDLTWR